MSKKKKLKADLILEVTQLQERVAELETADAEQKQALEMLSDSERRFKTIFTDAAIGIDIVDAEGSPILANRALVEMLGYSEDELRSMVFADYTHPDDIEESLRLVQEVREGKRDHFTMEKRYIRKDGAVIWGHTSVSGLRDARGNFQYFIAMVDDITERKQTEKVLKESEEQLKEAQALGRIGRWEYDIDTQKIKWSDQVFKLYERDPALGEPTPEEEATYYSPEDSEMLREYSRRAIEEGKSFEYDFQVQLPSGKTSYMTGLMRPITDESGRVIKLVGIVQDITERKQAEQELEDIFNLSPDMVGVFTTEGKLLKVNPAWEEILGYKPNELLDSGWAELVHSDDVEVTNKTVEKQLEGSSVVNFINRYKSKDGTYKTLEWQATYATEGIVHATARDVTEHMHLQAKLKTSEAIFKGIYSQAPVGIELFDVDGKLIDVNQECLDIFGVGHVEEIMGFRLFEDPNVSEDAKIQLRKGAPVDYESEFDFDLVKKLKLYKTTKSGKCFLQVQITPYVISGFDEKGYVVHVQDITERKQAEQAIQNAAQQWKIAFDAVTDGLMVLDTEQRITRTNQAMIELFPEHTDTMIGKYCFEVVHGTQKPIEDCPILRMQPTLKRERMELYLDDRVFEVLVDPILDESGDLTGSVHSIRDITGRKQVEGIIRKNQYYLTKAQEIGIIGTWELDLQTNILTWTDENYKIFGVPPGTEMNYELFLDCVHPDDREYVSEQWSAGIHNEPYDIEHRIIVKDEVKWVREKAEIEFDVEGNPTLAIGFTQDVTDRKQAEGKLIESEAYIKTVMDNLPIGLAVNSVDPTVEFNYMNDNFAKYYRTTREALEPQDSFWNAVYEDPVYRAKIKERVLDDIASGDPEKMHWVDIPITRKGEETTFISARNTPLPDTQLMVSTVWEVSERKQVEQEKDNLLKQVQVANKRLQTLSRALINSQEEERKHIAQELHDELGQALTAISLDLGIIERDLDPETDQDIAQRLSATRAMVDELDERISELALDLRPSLLDDLGLLPALRWYVDRYSQRAEVEIEMDINGLEERLPTEMETTLFRVFQEALTNVARHAQASKVRLQINRQPTAVVVNIEDDGRGFDAEEFQIKEVPLRSLGLAGMKERISHLGGHLDIRSKPGEGTRIDIEIPL